MIRCDGEPTICEDEWIVMIKRVAEFCWVMEGAVVGTGEEECDREIKMWKLESGRGAESKYQCHVSGNWKKSEEELVFEDCWTGGEGSKGRRRFELRRCYERRQQSRFAATVPSGSDGKRGRRGHHHAREGQKPLHVDNLKDALPSIWNWNFSVSSKLVLMLK
ncbi:hypothetical protein LWI29_019338 [Acer saccharum]|uniref:Uncharacterized protein n=1 Tax=Acer saccharum TaxID=4024 RepID=A0AA39W230_ACESA|nr:hypothetical protein LWI29_019338 [Acer saccharum]